MNLTAKAIRIAACAHEQQTDKSGKAYILHPIRMMMRLRTDDEEVMQIAIMHDVLEDTHWTADMLRAEGFSERVVNGVDALSMRPAEKKDYMAFIRRCAANPDALRVKLEDLRDNSDITRLKGIEEKDVKRMEKYHRAYTYLKGVQTAADVAFR